MNYLVYGINDYLINETIKKIIKENKMLKNDINHYDFNETPIKTIIDDAYTLPLFSNKKIIIIDNASLFTTNGNKDDGIFLEKYLEIKNPDTILIFISRVEKLDERKKVVKLFKQNNNITECSKTDINKKVTEMFDNYDISPSTIFKFISRVGNDLYNLKNEAEKLKIYKINDKKISDDDILFATKNIDDNIFNLIDYIISKDTLKAIELYNKMLKKSTEPIAILIMLANQIRILYQVKTLCYDGYNEKEIAETLEIHPYRVKLALEKSRNYSSTMLIDYLENLADLDYGIKTGIKEASIGLELFILGL